MSVSKQDIQREQIAHGETRKALERALEQLAARPTAGDLKAAIRRAEQAEAKAARHWKRLQDAPTKKQVADLEKQVKDLKNQKVKSEGDSVEDLKREIRRLKHDLRQAAKV